jgi:dihydrofolate reductase
MGKREADRANGPDRPAVRMCCAAARPDGSIESAAMARSSYYVAASLDGYIAEEDGGLQWLFDAADDPTEGGDANYDAFFSGVTAIAVGASTYEAILAHERPWYYPGRPTWVFTHRDGLPVPEGADVRFVSGAVADHIDDMRAAAGDGVLWVLGGGELASQFAEAGELEELIVSYIPVALGTGIPLFARRVPRPLELVSTEALERGIVQNVYRIVPIRTSV